jgi:glycine/D-amino acid oxidase-like deaminating enzyme
VRRPAALVDAAPVPFWLDDPAAPAALPPLTGPIDADLCVVGGGYTGLWTALMAKSAWPDHEVVLLEGDRCGGAASGRNGGFCAASLTHGPANGRERFPREIGTLEEWGRRNLDEIGEAVRTWSIDCDFERTGELSVATAPHEADALRRAADGTAGTGGRGEYLDRDRVQAEVHSPGLLAGLWDRDGCALVNPARLAWGLRRACETVGVRIHEGSPVDGVEGGDGSPRAPMVVRTSRSLVSARQVALATNAFPSPLRRLRRYVVPVYDYVLMTEPLTVGQHAAVGWVNRQGIGGSGNRFIYARLSADNRILFGGYDAVYYFGGRMGPAVEQREATFATLAGLFGEMFPQLAEVRFTHAWGGAIDTCSRFCAFFDRSHDGRVVSAGGYTGLGVGASRFGAQVMIDLLSGEETERTRSALVRTKPVPFPPEPFRYAGIQATRWSLARADGNGGRRNPWLRILDRCGMGFDS